MRIIRQGFGLYLYFKNSVWKIGWFKSLPKKPDPNFDSLIDQFKYILNVKKENKSLVLKE